MYYTENTPLTQVLAATMWKNKANQNNTLFVQESASLATQTV